MSHALGGHALGPEPRPEPFAHRRPAPLGRLDPRARLLAVTAFAGVVVCLKSPWVLALALLLAGLAAALARLPVGPTLKRMLAMDGFVVLMLLMLPFTTPGTPMFELWGLPASQEGLLAALRIGLIANAVVLALLALAGAMEATTLGHALGRLGAPSRLVHLLLFTIRYIDVLGQENRRLRTAMKARAFRPRNSLHTWRSYGYLVGMMLVRALERAERIVGAMKCRGFTGRLYCLDRLSWQTTDSAFLLLALALLAALVGLDMPGGPLSDWVGHAHPV
ncbi:cobalt ECF transporter T component CbiQ [Roseospirillum parvum]|uniref:Cobalt/nickel transport system permease protein n=1 Tax=Roseospirillum parvum TaxID=83401 RepID=A0A1G7VCU4_9PROT|nr:cobalt ECF transporter T component CbiQ [Roseospirillum parvum]SDG57381.1 cobalt/nickel transport system permease protein [Roseospirillum parvum]